MATEIADNAELSRYEVVVDGELAGLIDYRIDHGTITIAHTEIVPQFEGRGLGGTLVKAALDDVRERGLELVPLCPFVAAYVREHPDYLDLVAPSYRRRLERSE